MYQILVHTFQQIILSHSKNTVSFPKNPYSYASNPINPYCNSLHLYVVDGWVGLRAQGIHISL